MNLFEEDERLRPRWRGQPERTYQPPEILRCGGEPTEVVTPAAAPVVAPAAAPSAPTPQALHQDRQGRFRCDHCGGGLKVINSRPQDGYRLRRYQCLGCAERLTTVEVVVPGGINPHCSLAAAVARVMQNFVRRAPTTVLGRELQRRAAEPPSGDPT